MTVLEEIPLWALLSIALLTGALFTHWLSRVLRKFSGSLRARRRSARAQHGEWSAEALLLEHGYAIKGIQEQVQWSLEIDDQLHLVDLRVDMLVEKDGQTIVAEVKTGDKAPQISNAATRRQLLEYQMAFGCPEVLLVDVEHGRLHRVRFS